VVPCTECRSLSSQHSHPLERCEEREEEWEGEKRAEDS
jgi:hypothetical protein